MPRLPLHVGETFKGKTRSSNQPAQKKAPERPGTAQELERSDPSQIVLRREIKDGNGKPTGRWRPWRETFPLPKTTWYDTIKKIKFGFGPPHKTERPICCDTWAVLKAAKKGWSQCKHC